MVLCSVKRDDWNGKKEKAYGEDRSGKELHGTARKEDEEGRLIELNLASTYKMSEDVREEGQRKSSY